MYSRCLLLSLPAAPLTFPPHNKRAPLNALYGVKVGVLESCHLIGSEDFAIPQSRKTSAFKMAANLQGVLEDNCRENVLSDRILVVGAGGIGCELLKNLVLTGFKDIEVVRFSYVVSRHLCYIALDLPVHGCFLTRYNPPPPNWQIIGTSQENTLELQTLCFVPVFTSLISCIYSVD